jgi:hypothetical protein
LRVKNGPERVVRPDAVEKVVAGYHRHPERQDHRQRQPHQRRENDHRPTQRPDDDQHRHLVVDVELHAQTPDQRELQENQPEAAGDEES